ncbi:glutaminase family protein [Paenibacillus xanthanilyticus]|uniref:Glutaminase domain-containing protein n=1 Tax=Paenibacillus xanthanilyticus TaxID=1783531 RepID=A0ABV8K5P6_9BACL
MTTAFRPASVPLITVDPYFSVWSPADRLTDADPVHWTGKRNSLCGLIRIDGRAYRFMGSSLFAESAKDEETPAMAQTALTVEPLTTSYAFEAGGIGLQIQFATPLLLEDLDLLSRPVTYITARVRSIDGAPHQVKLYLDLSGELCVHSPDQIVGWSRVPLNETITALRMGTAEQPILARVGDDTRIDWGYAYLAALQSEHAEVKSVIGSSETRVRFARTGMLPEHDDAGPPRAVSTDLPVMAVTMDFGQVDAAAKSAFVAAAYDDVLAIEYFGTPLPAYWRRNGAAFEDMLISAMTEYDEVLAQCERFNRSLIEASAQAGGAKYAELLSLAYRQAIAAHKLVCDEAGTPLFFSKENFSNGCIATVDVSYPSIPLFLLYNPELVKGMMRPIFRYAASGEWRFDFAPHDVGCYPKANGQVYGENKLEYQMPIEECGNMLIMAAAVCAYEGKADFAREHWELLSKWAAYLKTHGLDPDNQLCTDDFAGHLAHNANLSIKAIIGIGAYARLCEMLGDAGHEEYAETAKEMAARWADMAAAGDHYKLTFDSPSDSWSLKYNLVWDRLLRLGLFPASIAETEVAHYRAKQNRYGTPLDSRNTYTKADWLVWSASLAASKADFEAMIAPLWLAQQETTSRVPLSDWYDTVTGSQIGFQNRSVVGGLFIALLEPARAAVTPARPVTA